MIYRWTACYFFLFISFIVHGENTLVKTTNKLVSTANIFIPDNLQKMFRATHKSVFMNCKMGWLNQFSFKQHDVRYLNQRRNLIKLFQAMSTHNYPTNNLFVAITRSFFSVWSTLYQKPKSEARIEQIPRS